jgi:acyl carrier protein
MGLDALDLTFRLEKRLGITIHQPEGFATFFDTVGTIHRYLVAKLNGECLSVPKMEPLFIELVKAVNQIAGRGKRTSAMDLNKRFPPATRAANWQALEEALGVSLPTLEDSVDGAAPRIPQDCSSLIALTYWIAEHHPERVEWIPVSCERTGKMASRNWTDQEVWDILQECICDALGVKSEQVTKDARMIEDLGMN